MKFKIGLVVILILIIWTRGTYGIIGYDCGAPSANFTTLSLIDIEECDIPLPKVNISQTYIQLLQIDEFKSTRVIQCKIEIDRIIRKCGMFSHTMDVHNGKYSYIHEVSHGACLRLHTYGSFELSGTLIAGLRSNETATRPIVLAGQVDNDGRCSGGAYSDPYGTWGDVIVLSSVKITLQDYIATVRLNTNKVQLRSGVTCELSAGHCTDIEGGNTFWDPVPEDTCKLSDYSSLYRGTVDKIIDYTRNPPQITYSLNSQDTVFALTKKGEYLTCGYKLIRTEHPKLVIFEDQPEVKVFQNHGRTSSFDLFTYMNSKFVYVEKHVRSQVNQLYRNILQQQCDIEFRLMQNALAIATRSPDIFAYHFMKGPGYMALLAGEVIHIVKCVPVDVKIAQTQECYEQLPVIRDNTTYFLTPQTHVLLRQGTQVTCNALAPSMYHLGGAWYKLLPKPVEALPPTIMKPLTRPTWKYVSPGALATSGIYTQGDLDELRDHIMFPAERPAVLNTVARGVMGETTYINGGPIPNFMDEASIKKFIVSTWQKFWGKFLIFGNVSAGLFGIYMCIRAIKLILDTLVHGYALHTVFGCSVYLIGAIWDSVTQLLLHLGKRRPKKSSNQHILIPTEEHELDENFQPKWGFINKANSSESPADPSSTNKTDRSHTCPLFSPQECIQPSHSTFRSQN